MIICPGTAPGADVDGLMDAQMPKTVAAVALEVMIPMVMVFPIQTMLVLTKPQQQKTMLIVTVAPTITVAAETAVMALAAVRLMQTMTV